MKKVLFLIVVSVFCFNSLTFSQSIPSTGKSCQIDKDCKSDGKHNCGYELDKAGRRTSFRLDCLCYEDKCIESGSLKDIVKIENWNVEDCTKNLDSINLCIKYIAMAKNDKEICLELGGEHRDTCYMWLVSENYDVQLCDLIQRTQRKALCVAFAARAMTDESICYNYNFEQNWIDYCVRNAKTKRTK